MSWRHGLAAGELGLDKPPLKAILLALAHHANEYTCRCWPSVERLALFTGLSRRSVQYSIKDLVELGYLIVHERPGKPSIYELTLPDCGPLNQGGAPPAPRDMNGGAPLAQGGATVAPEESGTDKTRVEDLFSEEWKPAPPIIERIKADEGLSDEEIERELKMFVLKNLEVGEPVRHPNAAFRRWCARLAHLKHQPAKPPAKAKSGPAEKIPIGIPDDDHEGIANLRAHLRTRMQPDTYAGWFGPDAIALKTKDKGVVIVAPSLFHGDWIRNQFDNPLREALEAAGFEGYQIKISPPQRGEEA